MIPRNPPLTMALVVISTCVYLLMHAGFEHVIVGSFLISEYVQPTLPEVFDGQVWRLITPMFLHFGIFHIVFNMLWTWELGRIIEWQQGTGLLTVVVVVTSLVANLSQYSVSGPLFGGMSGVIYGLFGYVWLQTKTNSRFHIQLNPAIVKLMFGWFIVCWSGLLERFFGLAVANTAHTAGLISGLLFSLFVSAMAAYSRK